MTAGLRGRLAGVALVALSPLPVHSSTDLRNHPSPYLRDHAADAVRWRAPGQDALAEARSRSVPLFVSSGYLACYWCHRLKVDTLQDPEVATLVNDNYVPVLLDRELHGADDRRLQDFMQASLGFSGWPVMAVVTPDGSPIRAWPYTRAPALARDLETVAAAWAADPAAVVALSRDRYREQAGDPGDRNSPPARIRAGMVLQAFLEQSGNVSDPVHGGFGQEAKYPYVPQLQVLLDLNQLNPSPAMSGFLRLSLDGMVSGELFDPVSGGVFRYTENPDWTEPHFEQMLYTQALVARLLIRAATALGEAAYATAAGRILDNMMAAFDAGDGWFVASLAATGEDGINGSGYLFAPGELAAALGEGWRSGVVVRRQYGELLMVDPAGPLATVTTSALASLRRESPRLRDEKRLVSWNGLALSALSHGAGMGRRYYDAASRLAGEMMRVTAGDGPGLLAGYAPDAVAADLDALVFAAAGLLDWWQVSGDDAVADRVTGLLEQALQRHYQDGAWRRARPVLFPPSGAGAFIADDQIPSPSAEWLRLVVTLRAADVDLPGPVLAAADAMVTQRYDNVMNEAFFHATLTGALVTRRFLGIN